MKVSYLLLPLTATICFIIHQGITEAKSFSYKGEKLYRLKRDAGIGGGESNGGNDGFGIGISESGGGDSKSNDAIDISITSQDQNNNESNSKDEENQEPQKENPPLADDGQGTVDTDQTEKDDAESANTTQIPTGEDEGEDKEFYDRAEGVEENNDGQQNGTSKEIGDKDQEQTVTTIRLIPTDEVSEDEAKSTAMPETESSLKDETPLYTEDKKDENKESAIGTSTQMSATDKGVDNQTDEGRSVDKDEPDKDKDVDSSESSEKSVNDESSEDKGRGRRKGKGRKNRVKGREHGKGGGRGKGRERGDGGSRGKGRNNRKHGEGSKERSD